MSGVHPSLPPSRLLNASHTVALPLRRLQSAVWAALACFALEYATLFSGVSLFFRTLNCSHILLHFVGAILTALFYTQASSSSRMAWSLCATPHRWLLLSVE